MPNCSQCELLDRRYRATIQQINNIVHGRFNNVGAKIRALYRQLDFRDETLEATTHIEKLTLAQLRKNTGKKLLSIRRADTRAPSIIRPADSVCRVLSRLSGRSLCTQTPDHFDQQQASVEFGV